jgi:hypothetical protein
MRALRATCTPQRNNHHHQGQPPQAEWVSNTFLGSKTLVGPHACISNFDLTAHLILKIHQLEIGFAYFENPSIGHPL